MATTEEFLITLGLDQASVQKVIDQINSLRNQVTPVTIPFETNAGQAVAGVAGATQSLGTIAEESMARFEDGIHDVEAGLKGLQKTIVVLSGVATLFTGFGFVQAAEESTNLARANVILGQSVEELAVVQEELRAIADEVGLSYTDMSAALFDVASAGIKGEDAIKAVTAAARVAAPTTATVTEAFNALATTSINFGLSFAEAGDKLVKTADLTRGSMTDVANAIALVGPTAAAASLGLDELGGAFAAITQSGQTGENAATLLFNAVISFIAPVKEAQESLDRLGVTTGSAAFKTQTLAEKIRILSEAAADGRIEIGQVFNQRAFRGIQALILNAEYLGTAIGGIAKSSGRTQDALDAFFQEAGPQFKLLRTAVGNLATVIGSDLLNALQSLIEGTTEFIKNNKALLVSFIKFGLVLGGLAASWITYRIVVSQVVAAKKVLTGISHALTAVLTFESASLWVNVKAWYANLTATRSASTSPILRTLRSIITFLGTETGVIYTNTVAWITNTAARFWTGFKAWLVGLYAVTAGLIVETWTVAANTAAWQRRNAVLSVGSRLWTGLSNILTRNIATMRAASVAAAALGSFIAGWQIGKAINGWLKLEKATDKYVRGTSTGLDHIRNLWMLAAPPVALYITHLALVAARERRIANTMTDVQRELLLANDAMARYNELVARGAGHSQAYAAALGNVAAEYEILKKFNESGRATLEDQQRLAAIQVRMNRLLEEGNARREQSVRLDKLLQNGAAIIKQTQEAWVEVLARVNAEYAKLQVGGLAGVLEGAQRFEKDFDVILQRFQVFNANLAALQTQIGRKDLNAKELQQYKADVEKAARDVALAYTTLTRAIAVERANITRIGQEHVAELRATAQSEIEAYRTAAEDVIKIEKTKLDELQKVYDKLVDARSRSVESVERFAQRLEAAQLRRRDPALAEVVELEKDFVSAIDEGVPSAEQAARAIGLLRTELARLVGPTSEEVRLQEELVRIQKDLQSVDTTDGDRGVEQRNELLERQKSVQSELTILGEKRSEREKQALIILERSTKAIEESVTAFQERDTAILELKRQIAAADFNIELAGARILLNEANINTKLDERIKSTEKFIGLQLQVLANAEKYAQVAGAASQEVGQGQITPEAQQQAVDARSTFLESLSASRTATEVALPGAEAIRQEIDAVGKAAKQVADFIVNVKDEFVQVNVEIARNGQVLIPAAQEVVTTFQGLQATFEPSQTALADMLQATERFAPAVTSFGETVVNTMTQQRQTLDKATTEIETLKARVDQLSRTGGGASGLPR